MDISGLTRESRVFVPFPRAHVHRLILSHPAYVAGVVLARASRPEYKTCVAGLRQYSIAFGHLWEQAEELEQIYRSSLSTRQSSFSAPSGSGMIHGSMTVDQLLSAPAATNGFSGAGGQSQAFDDARYVPPIKERSGSGQWNVPGAGAVLVSTPTGSPRCVQGSLRLGQNG